jgi:hypothetical protein
VMTPRQRRKREARQAAGKAPTGRKTTLYDVIAMLHSAVGSEEDDLVVEVVVCWLRAGRLHLAGDGPAAA